MPSDILKVLGEGRLDYVLQEGALENAAIGMAMSHLSYWKSDDTIMFLLRKVYGKEGVEVAQ